MILLLVFSAVPYTLPPKQPVELVVSKEGLAGKEIEVVEVDDENRKCFPFVLKPELPEVAVLEEPKEEKPVRIHKPPKSFPVKNKVSASRYNRRGIRNK